MSRFDEDFEQAQARSEELLAKPHLTTAEADELADVLIILNILANDQSFGCYDDD